MEPALQQRPPRRTYDCAPSTWSEGSALSDSWRSLSFGPVCPARNTAQAQRTLGVDDGIAGDNHAYKSRPGVCSPRRVCSQPRQGSRANGPNPGSCEHQPEHWRARPRRASAAQGVAAGPQCLLIGRRGDNAPRPRSRRSWSCGPCAHVPGPWGAALPAPPPPETMSKPCLHERHFPTLSLRGVNVVQQANKRQDDRRRGTEAPIRCDEALARCIDEDKSGSTATPKLAAQIFRRCGPQVLVPRPPASQIGDLAPQDPAARPP